MGDSILSTISLGFWILWGIVFVVLVALVSSVIRRNLKTRRAPIIQVRARLVSIEKPKGALSPSRGKFLDEEGKSLLLFIDRSKSASLIEGQEGLLTYKGNTYISLQR